MFLLGADGLDPLKELPRHLPRAILWRIHCVDFHFPFFLRDIEKISMTAFHSSDLSGIFSEGEGGKKVPIFSYHMRCIFGGVGEERTSIFRSTLVVL
jgi:hypothetical protein